VFGSDEICRRIDNWSWELSTTFTGASCIEVAAASIEGHCRDYIKKFGTADQKSNFEAKSPLSFGYSADFEKGPQRLLQDTLHWGPSAESLGFQNAVRDGLWGSACGATQAHRVAM
jgi:hypothetical protein